MTNQYFLLKTYLRNVKYFSSAKKNRQIKVGCYWPFIIEFPFDEFLAENNIFIFCLQTYLRNLKKKQKELSKKHNKDDDELEQPIEHEDVEEEDSDLASIARELQDEAEDSDNIFNSPFIKKPNQTKVRHTSDNTTPLPEKEFSFIGSNKKPTIDEEQVQEPNTSKALDKFMRFDKKYSNFKVIFLF